MKVHPRELGNLFDGCRSYENQHELSDIPSKNNQPND